METKREARSFLMPREITEENDYDEIDSEDECDDTQSTGSCEAAETGAFVYLRLKPVEMPSPAYSIADGGKILITGPHSESASSSRNKNSVEKHFSFSEIFDSEVSQREVYEMCIEEKIKTEESLTILTYGTSGSGKTFTLLGDDLRPGIIPRSLEQIFALYQSNIHPSPLAKLVNSRTTLLDDNQVEKESILRRQVLDNCENLEKNCPQLQHSIQSEHNFETIPFDDVSVFIWVTFVEIYNELVYDLLAPIKSNGYSQQSANQPRKNLKIVCNDGNVFIKGVTSVHIKSSLEALKLLRSGLQKITYASTSINANSSRSHCVFFVDVLKYYRTGVYTETSYKFCDLAGSERLDISGNTGSALKEAQRTNTSQMILGRCLDAANNMASSNSTTFALNKKERIPFRESKLTMILQAALQGREKLAMIVNVTPTEQYYEENLNVLNFCSIARNIIFKAPVIKQNQSHFPILSTIQDTGYIQQQLLKKENANLKAGNEKLNRQLEDKSKQLEELLRVAAENYDLRDEIDRVENKHYNDLLIVENEVRDQYKCLTKNTLDEIKKEFEQRLQYEIGNKVRFYESRIEILKKRHQEDIENLRDVQKRK